MDALSETLVARVWRRHIGMIFRFLSLIRQPVLRHPVRSQSGCLVLILAAGAWTPMARRPALTALSPGAR